tara:strand:- start:30 stop:206 length:177 start_codon:yes stop_codon:yes gene_type:complete
MPLLVWGGVALAGSVASYFVLDKAEEAVVESSSALSKLTLAVAVLGGLYIVGKQLKAW